MNRDETLNALRQAARRLTDATATVEAALYYRSNLMWKAVDVGATHTQIAAAAGVSRQRVSQILNGG